MVFQTAYKPVAMTSERAFLFFAQADNLKVLMPEQILDWESGDAWCRFKIQGMGHVKLHLTERHPYYRLSYSPVGKMPFAFSLCLQFCDKADACEMQIVMDADLSNPMMAMLAQKPLQNLVNAMYDRL